MPQNCLPGDFQPQSAVLLGVNELVRYHPAAFGSIIEALHNQVRVIGLVAKPEEVTLARTILDHYQLPPDAVDFVQLPLNSMWVRDYGPFFIRRPDGQVHLIDSEYDAVGNDTERADDDAVPQVLAGRLGLPVEPMPLHTEGGNVLSNGEGLCVSTTRLVERNAERGLGLTDVGQVLADHLGVKTWIYVPMLKGEPTGHADMFMCFLAPNVVVVGRIDPRQDPDNAAILDFAANELAQRQTRAGPMQVHRIPMPPPRDGVWRTYTNVLIANGVLLAPVYSDIDPATQSDVLGLYERLLPGYRIVPITADTLAPKRGLLHCISLNVPAGVDLAPLLDGAKR